MHVVTKGPHTPTIMVNEVQTPKPINDYSRDDKKLASMNAKAMNILYSVLEKNEVNHIFTCTNAHDIWHLLEITHEGTNQVKESKISMLVHSYELFKMDTNETITYMFTRFTSIINELNALGKTNANSNLIRKLLRSLPKTWKANVTTI